MPLISSTIPNLINGVSQQPSPTRIRTAGEVAQNCYMSVVSGLQKRQNSAFVSSIGTLGSNNVATHIFKTSSDKRYMFVMDNEDISGSQKIGRIRAFNIDDGSAIQILQTPVTDPATHTPDDTTQEDTLTYLTTSDPKKDLRFTTVADQTFIANAAIKVGTSAGTPAADKLSPTGRVSVFIKRSVPNTTYAIYVNSAKIAECLTQTNQSVSEATEGTAGIATKLMEDIPDSDITVSDNSVITIRNKKVVGSVLTFTVHNADDTLLDADITVLDQFGGAAMRIIQDEIQEFSDLPPMELKGRMVKVVGDADAEGDDYWVRFSGKVWVEDVGFGSELKLDETTMPYRMVYRENSSGDPWFELLIGEYSERVVGDENSNAAPTFVDNYINGIFLYKGRMGYLTDENLVMSEVSEYGNFWRTTATQVLDTDRIDVASTTGTVNILRHATAFGNSLVLFSDTQQFKVTQGDVLSPATVGLQPMTTYDGSRNVAPVNSGPNVFFAVDGPRFTIIREMYINEENGEQFDAAEVTVQVPKYIPTGVNQMVVSTYEDALVLQAGEKKNELYIYKWYLEGKTKVQSAWSKWKFADDIKILSLVFMDQDLFMVYTRGSEAYIDKIRLEESVAIDGEQSLLLDHQLVFIAGDAALSNIKVSPVYDFNTNTTTFTLPVPGHNDLQFWTLQTMDNSTPPVITVPFGLELAAKQNTTNSREYVITGDHRTTNLVAGYPYEFLYQFSDQFVRTQSTGSDIAIQDGRLQIRYMSVVYQNSSYFVADVEPRNRDTRSYVFNARTLADSTNALDTVPVETGEYRFPIAAQNTKVKISLKSDKPFACSFGLAEWDGMYHPRTQRI